MSEHTRDTGSPDGETAAGSGPAADAAAAANGTAPNGTAPNGTGPSDAAANDTARSDATAKHTAPSGTAADGAGPGDTAAAGTAAEADSADTGPGGSGVRPPDRRRRRRRKRSFWREFPILVAVALILAVLIKSYALQAFFIPSGSMENTLEVNDRVLINKLVYDFRGIHRGDIVVFDGDGSWDPGTVPSTNPFAEFASNFASMFGFGHPGDIYVKRVIGLPGDHVACCDAEGRVTVNGVPLSESSYLYPGDVPSVSRFNIVVPSGQLWVMGDHRSVSADSRDHLGDPGGGTIPVNSVLGRAFIIIWPPSRWRILPIPATFGQSALDKQAAAAAAASGAGQLLADGARLQSTGPVLPLSLGFAGAVPVTWFQRRVRRRIRRRRREIP